MADKTLWFRHDVGTMNDIRMQKIMRKYGLEGIGIYWCLIETMYTNNGRIFHSEIADIAFMIHADEEKVAEMASDQDIFESDEDSFWSNRVNSELSIQQEVSEKAKEAINARWKNQKKAKSNSSNSSTNPEKSYERNTDVIRANNERNTSVLQSEYVRNTQTDRQTDNTDRQTENNTSCSEPSEKSDSIEAAPPSPVFLELPCIISKKNPTGMYAVTEAEIAHYEQTYLALDIRQELREMHAWLIANPTRKKSNVSAFIVNWLKRSQDRFKAGPPQPRNPTPTGMAPSAMRTNDAFKGHKSGKIDF